MRHARRNSAPPSRSRAIAALAALLLTSGLGVTAAYATPSDGAALDEVAALQDEAAKGAGESTEVPADGLTPQPEANDSSTEITDAPEAESQPNESSAVPTVADESLSLPPDENAITPTLPEDDSTADQGAQLRSTPPNAPPADGPSLLAVPVAAVAAATLGPEAVIGTPYVYWDLRTAPSGQTPLIAGGTFQLQGPRERGTNWGTTYTVVDCVVGPCTGYDQDPDPGEFQVPHGATGPQGTISMSTSQRWRVRPASSPASWTTNGSTYSFTSSTTWWTSMDSADWANGTRDFGNFYASASRNQPQCGPGFVYGVTENGQVRQIDPNGAITALGSAASGVSSFNGLGIGENGASVFAYERSNFDRTARVWTYNAATGIWSQTNGVVNSTTDDRTVIFVAGAVDPTSGTYYIGGFNADGTRFRLWAYNPANATITYKGALSTGSSANATNGDMAFNALGDLFVVRGSGTSTTVLSVTAANLAAASGGTITAAVSASFETQNNVNGVAFDSDGRAFLGSTDQLRSYAMPNWSGSQTVVSTGLNTTDLASCSSPPTITIQKEVVGGRVNSSDVFNLSLTQNGTVLGTAAASSPAVGVQDQRIGPLPTVRHVSLNFAETVSGSGSNLSNYASAYQCTLTFKDGSVEVLDQVIGTSGSITIPSDGEAVVCTFRNSPLTAQVVINKQVTDSQGSNPSPRQGWTVSSGANATVGTITPSAVSSQATGASGSATWNYVFGSSSGRADVTVSEFVQQDYVFQSGQCVITHINGNSEPVGLTGPDAALLTGIAPGDRVECTYVNKPTPGLLAITKAFDQTVPSGSGNNIAFKGTYSCVIGATTVASGTWTRTGAGAATLTPPGTGIPPGAECTVLETPPTGSDGLPNSSYVWDSPQVDGPVTIASGATSTVTVTNRAKRVYGSFQVTKVVPDGSVVDAGSTFSGQWSCLPLGETTPITDTWGPISAAGTWTAPLMKQIPLGATCSVTSEDRAEWPVAGDHSHQWDGGAVFSDPVLATAAEQYGTVTVTNKTLRTLGGVVWSKVDGSSALLGGSEWLLTGPGLPTEGQPIVDCVVTAPIECTGPDKDSAAGAFKLVDLLWGDYTLVETKAPAGYQLHTTNHTFTIGSDTLALELPDIVNVPRTGPPLPLTGGLGADGFALVGGGLLAAAAAALLFMRRRRAES